VVNRGGIGRRARLATTLLDLRDGKSSTNLKVAKSPLKLDLSSYDSANVPWIMAYLSLSLIECINSS
jgi:hypothetical protein